MVEYYKTQKGYCYKKTQKGGSKRISNKDYEKKTKLKSGGNDPESTPRQNNNTNKSSPSPLTTTTTQQQAEGELEFNDLIKMNNINLNSDYNKITEEINNYITETNYEISVNDNKISIKEKGQGGGKQNKRKNKKQKGGVNIDLKLLLKKLKCFGNTDFSQNANQKKAIQEIEKVYNHMDNKYKYTINQLQNNANLPLSAFEKLSKDIINESIPDFIPSKMIETIKSDYNERCNTNQQPQPQQIQSQKQNKKNANNNNYSSDVFKLVIALCVLIVNKLNVLPRLNVNKNINKITVFGYVVYLLALLFLKILKEMKRITII